jgi:hypothetical protein
LEELLPKDNETIHLPLDGPLTPSEPPGFTPEEMIRCEQCLRANPPTRFACLYCDAALPLNESTEHLRKPILRQPEKHQLGINCILVPTDSLQINGDNLTKAAELLKLKSETLDSILATKAPMPLARTGSREEAQLVNNRLRELGFSTVVLSDEDLGRDDTVIRVRSLQLDSNSLFLGQAGVQNSFVIAWDELRLIVSGRLVVQKVEVTERVSRRPENEILDTSEFFSDEPVFDLYCSTQDRTLRIGTNSFDFSCLQNQKSFIAAQNLRKLQELMRSRCASLQHDSVYNELRNTLQLVWPCEQESHSRGWRRERPGKYSLGAVTSNTNESQFTRYSRLRRYFAINN